jgi:hypothetical protein
MMAFRRIEGEGVPRSDDADELKPTTVHLPFILPEPCKMSFTELCRLSDVAAHSNERTKR